MCHGGGNALFRQCGIMLTGNCVEAQNNNHTHALSETYTLQYDNRIVGCPFYSVVVKHIYIWGLQGTQVLLRVFLLRQLMIVLDMGRCVFVTKQKEKAETS